MIKPSALVMGVVMAAVSTGTYFGLDVLPPGVIPPPIGRVVAEEKTAGPAPAPETQVATAAPAPVPAPATEAEPTEQDLAEEPPPPAEAPVSDEPEPAPAAAAPAPEPEPAAQAPAPKAAEAPKPAPKPVPKPAAEPEPEQKPEAVASAPAASTSRKPPESDVIKPWWPTDTSNMPANQLKLQYAGQVQGQGAVALLFSSPLKIDSVKQYASVRTASGQPVKGDWELGKNPKLAVFSGLQPGRYTVILQPQVADMQGYMLGQTLKGPVYIKE